MRPLAAFLFFAAALHAQPGVLYQLGPDSQPQPNVPQGTILRATLPPGKFYPGTPHDYAIYVPKQYDSSKAAPYMIFMDGIGQLGNTTRANVVFDNLIARHELPPIIGIFVNPGVLPAVGDGQRRFERVFEYDSISDRFSHFLLEELVPAVAAKFNLSQSADDHALAGVSTGAVAAFVAAWNRPDQFHRVVTFIGTFVAMKGADSLPALVRKTEPKPIRIFMQDGKQDHIVAAEPFGTFYSGSWPINNQVMYESLEAAGYDVKFEMGEDGHSGRHGASILPDVLRWLWRDYPAPITVKEPAHMQQAGWDPRAKVYSIVSADKGWAVVGARYGPISSLAADSDGNLYFAADNKIYKSDSGGKVTVFKENVAATVLAVGPGNLLRAATSAGILYCPPTGRPSLRVRTVPATGMVIGATDPIYLADSAHKAIGYLKPERISDAFPGKNGEGAIHTWTVGYLPARNIPVPELSQPSSLTLSSDQAMLIVTDAASRFQWSFQIAADGSLQNGEPFYRLEIPETTQAIGASSVMEDSIGQVYFATPLGIQVCEANGRVAAILNSPAPHQPVTAIAWGGKDLDWIYAAAGGHVFRRPVKVKGAAPWAVLKLPVPPL